MEWVRAVSDHGGGRSGGKATKDTYYKVSAQIGVVFGQVVLVPGSKPKARGAGGLRDAKIGVEFNGRGYDDGREMRIKKDGGQTRKMYTHKMIECSYFLFRFKVCRPSYTCKSCTYIFIIIMYFLFKYLFYVRLWYM